jgi:hypothetical protein
MLRFRGTTSSHHIASCRTSDRVLSKMARSCATTSVRGAPLPTIASAAITLPSVAIEIGVPSRCGSSSGRLRPHCAKCAALIRGHDNPLPQVWRDPRRAVRLGDPHTSLQQGWCVVGVQGHDGRRNQPAVVCTEGTRHGHQVRACCAERYADEAGIVVKVVVYLSPRHSSFSATGARCEVKAAAGLAPTQPSSMEAAVEVTGDFVSPPVPLSRRHSSAWRETTSRRAPKRRTGTGNRFVAAS